MFCKSCDGVCKSRDGIGIEYKYVVSDINTHSESIISVLVLYCPSL